MLICVDGKGGYWGLSLPKFREADYAQKMAGSFVGMTYYGALALQRNRIYRQGPDILALLYLTSGASLVQQIAQFWSSGDRQIFLVGYSREGAIVIRVADMLTYAMSKGVKPKVDAMFLFDAVDRTIQLPWNEPIPPNVKVCYRAMRDPSMGSRCWFGNCGTDAAPGVLVKKPFKTTHGGMGGVLWGEKGIKTIDPRIGVPDYGHGPLRGPSTPPSPAPVPSPPSVFIDEGFGETKVTVAQEKLGSAEVWTWMRINLKAHGLR